MRHASLAAIALLLAARLAAEPSPAEPSPGETLEIATPAATETKVETLEAQIRAQADELERLRAELETWHSWLGSVAMPLSHLPPRKGRTPAPVPTSGLDRDMANRAAMAARLMVKDAGALHVLPTGSMRPTFDENAILLTEPVRFEDIRVGDIVTFRHPDYPVPVVHRVLEKRGERYWSKGDANGLFDDIQITRENLDRRVFGIIYAREPAAAPIPH